MSSHSSPSSDATNSANFSGAFQAYDWDDYRSDFKPNAYYDEQERLIREFLSNLPEDPESIFEAGPGFGRITDIVSAIFPRASYRALDVSRMNLHSSSFDRVFIRPLQAPGLLEKLGINDLVIAVEVMMHIPPDEVYDAFNNLVSVTNPAGGILITCDWTKALPNPDQPVRVQNFRHDYQSLIERHPALASSRVAHHHIGYQTLYILEMQS